MKHSSRLATATAAEGYGVGEPSVPGPCVRGARELIVKVFKYLDIYRTRSVIQR